MLNANKLKGKIKENGLTQAQVAKILKIAPNTLASKLTGKTAFTLPEAVLLKRNLHLSAEETEEIFFGPEIA